MTTEVDRCFGSAREENSFSCCGARSAGPSFAMVNGSSLPTIQKLRWNSCALPHLSGLRLRSAKVVESQGGDYMAWHSTAHEIMVQAINRWQKGFYNDDSLACEFVCELTKERII